MFRNLQELMKDFLYIQIRICMYTYYVCLYTYQLSRNYKTIQVVIKLELLGNMNFLCCSVLATILQLLKCWDTYLKASVAEESCWSGQLLDRSWFFLQLPGCLEAVILVAVDSNTRPEEIALIKPWVSWVFWKSF